jgi:hypothetical protein
LYLVGLGERDSIAWFDAKFARVEGRLLLDLTYTDSVGLAPEIDDMMLRTHMLVLIEQGKDRLLAWTLEDTRLTAAIDEGRLQVPYTELRHDLILTGTTDQLWRMARDLERSDFSSDPNAQLKWHRLAGPP